jgi:hypothetical protein
LNIEVVDLVITIALFWMALCLMDGRRALKGTSLGSAADQFLNILFESERNAVRGIGLGLIPFTAGGAIGFPFFSRRSGS